MKREGRDVMHMKGGNKIRSFWVIFVEELR